MASISSAMRTCGLIVYLILNVCAVHNNASVPWITSIEVSEKSCVNDNCKYLLYVHGGEFLGHLAWKLTPREHARGSSCDLFIPTYKINEIETGKWVSKIELSVPNLAGKIFFCLHYSEKKNTPFGGEWVHQGAEIFLEVDDNSDDIVPSSPVSNADTQNSNLEQTTEWKDLSHDIDVNNLPGHMRPTREEAKDIEILVNDKYVNLNDFEKDITQNVVKDSVNSKLKSNLNEIEVVTKDADVNNGVNQFHVQSNVLQTNSFNRRKRNILEETSVKPVQMDTVESGEVETPEPVEVTVHKLVQPSKSNDITNPINVDDETKPVSLVNKDDINHIKAGDETTTVEVVLTSDVPVVVAVSDTVQPTEMPMLPTTNLVRQPTEVSLKSRIEREADNFISDDVYVRSVPPPVKIDGLTVEFSDKEPKIGDNNVPSVLAQTTIILRLFGDGLTERTMIAFTYENKKFGEPCKFLLDGEYMAKKDTVVPRSALFQVIAPLPLPSGSVLYICAKNVKESVLDPFQDEDKYMHQGTETYKSLATHTKLLPLWVSLILILTCLMFSALFSGLNLGLMSLDRTELKIISNTGTDRERKYARAIMPVRDHGNYLLCSILLGNVAVNSTFTILLDDLTSGLFAVIFSTLLIVLFGEITPQAICSRHGLMIGARSICVTKSVMGLTAPLAFPVSKLLDYFLGEEIGSVYNRERLKELVKVTTDMNDLDRDEVNIISGALELRKKTVSNVMTKLEDVYMLPISSVLDFETMSEIIKSGYSRIPVYEGQRGNIVTVLFIKDLAFVDPDDNTPLRTLCQYYQNTCNFVFEDVTLDVMFKQFKDGHKGHMAFVHRINNEGEGDPFYETIGLVTLEDVIEEMIQAEIVDETDVFMDNRTKRRRFRPQNKLQDFAAFAERHENQRIHISPQLTLATFQFLSTSVEAFRPDTVSETVLRRLLKQDVIHYIKLKGKAKKDPCTYVYHQGKPVDYFVLILEGRVEVTVGRENLVFEAGPFTYFGVQALTQNVGVAESPSPSAMGSLQNINMDAMLRHTFVPDYSVRAISELYYLTVKRSLYLAAKRATLMEKGALSKGATNEQFDTEVDKIKRLSTPSHRLLSEAIADRRNKDDVLVNECFNLVTVYGRPLEMMDDLAFRNIMNLIPIEDMQPGGLVNSIKLKSAIAEKATEIRKNIIKEIRFKMISIKLDTATRFDRVFVSVNAQFVRNAEIVVRTLNVFEVRTKTSPETLRDRIVAVFNTFSIDISQIYAIVVDFGTNMISMKRIIDRDIDSYQEYLWTRYKPTFLPISDIVDHTMPSTSKLNDTEVIPELSAAHLLDTAVVMALDDHIDTNKTMVTVRLVVMELRSPKAADVLMQANKLRPNIDCPNIWLSSMEMLEDLMNLKMCCSDQIGDPLYVSQETWSDIINIIRVLEAVNTLAEHLQRVQMTFGDLYSRWIYCIAELRKVNTPLAECMIESLDEAKRTFLTNKIYLAAIYLDVRINMYLSHEEIIQAREFILAFAQGYKEFKKQRLLLKSYDLTPYFDEDEQVDLESTLVNPDKLKSRSILKVTERRKSKPLMKVGEELDFVLTKFLEEPRLKHSENVLRYWEYRKLDYPELYQIAMILLAVPVSRTTLENLFSSLEFAFSYINHSLNEPTIDNVELIRNNPNFIYESSNRLV